MRDPGSFWSLDQQQQQPGICMELTVFYGIVSYAVGVSLILSITGIKSGRWFFLHRRHSGCRSGHILGYGRANHHPLQQLQQQQQQRQQRQQQQEQEQELVGLEEGLALVRYLNEELELNPEAVQESGLGTPSGGLHPFFQ
jgi:hypothetical protein